ncbi:MAG: DUF362 domain-containing protein, partial [Candidatus Eisenbacteria bacterium]|nr:DUF362 domain-containing protein [Candidatus Eisenbacteria bacterium]
SRVVLKPNAVLHHHALGLDLFSIVTHPAVVRAVLDYVWIALQAAARAAGGGAVAGRISIADAPQFNSDWAAYLSRTGMGAIPVFYRERTGFEVELLDLRRMVGENDAQTGIASGSRRRTQEGDPRGYALIDLGDASAFADLPGCDRIYAADYDRAFASSAHLGGRHEYCVSRTVLESDLFISLPKLKTHGKVGVTLNLKGLVGINGDKNYVPHYRIGAADAGGDEYPPGLDPLRRQGRAAQRVLIDRLLASGDPRKERLYRTLTAAKQSVGRVLRRVGVLSDAETATTTISAGDWSGNDTAWRMTHDLARVLLHADRDGVLRPERQRRFLGVIDGVVAGEGDGPLEPTPRPTGCVFAGLDPAVIDFVAATLMGSRAADLPQLRVYRTARGAWLDLPAMAEIRVRLEEEKDPIDLEALAARSRPFAPPVGWRSW